MFLRQQRSRQLTRLSSAITATTFIATTSFSAVSLADPAALLSTEPGVWSPDEAADKDRFGSALATDASRAAVGASGVDRPKEGAGAVYILEHDGTNWRETDVLLLDDSIGVETQLGTAVSLQGNWVAAGAPGVYAGAGAVFLFQQDNGEWSQQHRFLLPEDQDFTHFGSSLDMSEDLLIVGAPGYDAGASDRGIVMVYERTEDGWMESARLQTGTAQEGERLGSAVALDGNRAVVGADGSNAAYIFEHADGEWSQVTRLSEDVGDNGGYGASVAVSGDTVLIGAPFSENDAGEALGTAYIYTEENGSWVRQAELASPTPKPRDQFADALALTDDMALVASPRDDTAARDAGAVFVFSEDGGSWTLSGRLSLPDPADYDEFGRSLAVNPASTTLLIGSPNDAGPDTTEGYPGTVTGYRW